MTQMDHYPDVGIIDGREIDFEDEIASYACGLAIHDGREISPCPNTCWGVGPVLAVIE